MNNESYFYGLPVLNNEESLIMEYEVDTINLIQQIKEKEPTDDLIGLIGYLGSWFEQYSFYNNQITKNYSEQCRLFIQGIMSIDFLIDYVKKNRSSDLDHPEEPKYFISKECLGYQECFVEDVYQNKIDFNKYMELNPALKTQLLHIARLESEQKEDLMNSFFTGVVFYMEQLIETHIITEFTQITNSFRNQYKQ